MSDEGFLCRPIGVLRCGTQGKSLLPPQPEADLAPEATIELFDGRHLDMALTDLAGFSRIWLLWWFHRNLGWRPKVRPPRGDGTRRGVLATRAPYRPNPIGLTSVPLLGVKGRTLFIGPHDLLDETPILDIKPYLPDIDAFSDERTGWLAETPVSPQYEVVWSDLAQSQRNWLTEHYHHDFPTVVETTLSCDPTPHKTRRIVKLPHEYRFSSGTWRLFFSWDGGRVVVLRIESGLPVSTTKPEAELHRRFRAQRW